MSNGASANLKRICRHRMVHKQMEWRKRWGCKEKRVDEVRQGRWKEMKWLNKGEKNGERNEMVKGMKLIVRFSNADYWAVDLRWLSLLCMLLS